MRRILITLVPAFFVLAACGDPAASNVEIEPAAPGPFVENTPVVTTPGPAPDGPYSVTPKAGEELPTSQTTAGPIPVAFRHVWASDKKGCTADPSLTRIAIAPGAVRFYQGRAVVITANTGLEGTVAMEVDQTSEGTTNREAHTLALNPAKTTLTYDRNGEVSTYVRCD